MLRVRGARSLVGTVSRSMSKASLLAVLFGRWICGTAFGGGYFYFDNIDGTTPGGPVTISTAPGTFNPVGGPPGADIGSNYTASLFWLDCTVTNHDVFDASNPNLYAHVDTRVYGTTSTDGLGWAGFFLADEIFLPGPTGMVITAQIRAWYNGNGVYSNYFQAQAAGQNVGESNPVKVYLEVPLTAGTTMDGLQLFSVGVIPLGLQIAASGLGARSNAFSFNLTGPPGATVIIEATTNLADSDWSPLQTNVLLSQLMTFQDLLWTNYPQRYYRMRTQ